MSDAHRLLPAAPAVLHQWEASPFCRKVGLMLDFKGIPYEKKDYNGLRGIDACLILVDSER